MTTAPSTLLPAMKLCADININRRTLDRWLKDASLGFPEPIAIRGRLFFDQSKIEAWKRQRFTASRKPKAPTTAISSETAAA